MRRRRWRWAVAAAIVLMGALFALDVVMVQYLESRGAAEIARTMSAEDTTVELGGFPFLPRFIGGRLSGVSVRVRGATARGGLRVDLIDARMASVSFDSGKMFALARSSFATKTQIEAMEPVGIVELEEQDLEDYVRRIIPQVGDVKVEASGVEVRFLRPGVEITNEPNPDEDDMTKPARFLPAIEDRRLILRLTSVSQLPYVFRNEAARIEGLIEIPRVPEGLRSAVSLRNGVIVVEAQGLEVKLTVGEARS